jgi:GNAT superfamily N-acetyltransferase
MPDFLVAERAGAVVGVQGMVPIRFRMGDRTVVAACTCDFAVDPAARGIGLRLKLAAMSREVAPFAFSTSSNASANSVTRALGGSALDAARTTYRLPLRITAILRRRWPTLPMLVAGAAADGVLAGRRGMRGSEPPNGLRWRSVDSFGPEFDRLWHVFAPRHPVQVVRDAAYLEWRYRRSPYGSAWAAALTRGTDVHGLVVVGLGRTRAAILELLDDGSAPGITRALIRSATRYAARGGAELLEARTSDPWLSRVLVREGFRTRVDDNSPVTYRVAEECLAPLLVPEENWQIGLGDGDAWTQPHEGPPAARRPWRMART